MHTGQITSVSPPERPSSPQRESRALTHQRHLLEQLRDAAALGLTIRVAVPAGGFDRQLVEEIMGRAT